MTVACNLFGAGFVCESMLAEPDRLSVLLSFITDATIRRIQALRVHFGLPLTNTGFWFADDSCALLSAQAYTEHILPHHRKLCDTLAPEGSRAIHLCGDATRLFPTIAAEIRVSSFDTGFPVDFAELRRRLGPDIEVFGGPHIELLRTATEAEVRRETRRILASGIMSDGQFVLREGNNVAPGTPPANIAAMYRTAQEVGVVRPPTSSGAANA
jgi:uroporphyrinogen-III decarboxylase